MKNLTFLLCFFFAFALPLAALCRFGCSVAALGRSCAALVPLLAALRAALGRSWAALGRSWAALGRLLGRSWPLLGRSWATFGRSWVALGRSRAALRRARRPNMNKKTCPAVNGKRRKQSIFVMFKRLICICLFHLFKNMIFTKSL